MRGIDPLLVRIDLTARGDISFNGEIVSAGTLSRYLALVNAQEPNPALLFSFDPKAPCNQIEMVRRILDSLPMCKRGYCGEADAWQRFYGPPIAPPSRESPENNPGDVHRSS